MSKSVLGVAFLVVAAVNMYWAAEIFWLKSKKGSPEELRQFSMRAKRLALLSRISYFIVSIVFLIFILKGGVK